MRADGPITPGKPRLIGIDAGRAIAALGTVWIHAVRSDALQPTMELGRFAVPFFNVIAALLLVRHLRERREQSVLPYAGQRFMRLYPPFLAWTVIYILANDAKRLVLTGRPPLELTSGFLLDSALQGPEYQLWFLPFLLICTLVGLAVGRPVIGNRRAEIGVGILAAAGGLAIALTPRPEALQHLQHAEYLMERSWLRVPSFLWGYALGLFLGSRPLFKPVPLVVAVAAPILAAGCIVVATLGWCVSLLQNLSGLGLVLFAFGPWRNGAVGAVSKLGQYSFGIYLAHVLFVEGTHSVGTRLNFEPSWWLDLVAWVVALVGSVVLTRGLRLWRGTRWLAPP